MDCFVPDEPRPRAVGERNENAVDPDLTAGPEDVSRDDGIRAYGAQDSPANVEAGPMEPVAHAGDHCWGHAVQLAPAHGSKLGSASLIDTSLVLGGGCRTLVQLERQFIAVGGGRRRL